MKLQFINSFIFYLKKIIFKIFILLVFGNLFSQQPDFSVPKVVMPSPNAAQLVRVTEFPVGNYTGTVNIPIPIYTIESGSLKLPITATYNTGGIKVNQEASWIGLGWHLSAGGSITRVIRDKDDLGGEYNSGRLFNWEFPDNTNFDPYISNTSAVNSTEDAADRDLMLAYFQNSEEGLLDLEPDSYYFNFGNHSGQFLLPPNNTGSFDLENYYPVILGESNVDIKLIPIQGESGSYDFEITDILGTKYYFGITEKTAAVSYSETSVRPKYIRETSWRVNDWQISQNEVPFETSTWHLSSITSVEGDKIEFEYGNRGYVASRNAMNFILERKLTGLYPNFNPTPTNEDGYCQNIYSGSVNEMTYLKKITFKNGEVNFITDYRDDLEQYDGQEPLRLTKIIIKDTINKSVVQEVEFHQNYFNPQDEIGEDSYKLSRLKLNGLTIKDVQSKVLKPYLFDYYSGKLPSKESFGMDHWGYNNGKSYNSHLLPRFGYTGKDYNINRGADRGVNIASLKIGALKSVQYPTKGKVEFIYGSNKLSARKELMPISFNEKRVASPTNEINSKRAFAFYVAKDSINIKWNVDLSYTGAQCDELNWNLPDSEIGYVFSGVLGDFESSLVIPNITNVTPDQEVVVDITDLDVLQEIEDTFENEHSILSHQLPDNIDELCLGSQSYSNLKLYKGWHIFYCGKANNEGNGLYLQADFAYPDAFELRTIYEEGPGLRIEQQILNSGNYTETTKYEYESFDEDGNIIVHGRLLSEPRYHTQFDAFTLNLDSPRHNMRIFEVSSNSLQDIGAIENKGVLGYNQVKVYKNNISENGQSVYQYHNSSLGSQPLGVYQYTRVPRNMPSKNGKLKREDHYNKDGKPISSRSYEYRQFYRNKIEGIKFINRSSIHQRSWASTNTYLWEGRNNTDIIWGYGSDEPYLITDRGYYFKRYNILANAEMLTGVTEKTYNSNSNNSITKITKNRYDPKYLLPITTTSYIKTSNQEYEQDIIFNKYPFSYTLTDQNNPLSRMKQRDNNLLGQLVEQEFWKKKPGLPLILVGSKLTRFNQNLLPEKIFSLDAKNLANNPVLPSTDATFNEIISSDREYNQEVNLSYTETGRIKEIIKLEELPSKYYWSYNEAYPVIKVEKSNIDIELLVERSSVLPSGFSTLESLLLSLNDITSNDFQKSIWKQYNENLRNALPSAMVTTYTYAPLIGVTSITDPKGYTIYYEYDDFNRLKAVKDAQGNLVEDYEYHYRGEQ